MNAKLVFQLSLFGLAMAFGISPRVMMALVGPLIGVASGIVLGVLAVLATRLLRPA
jgi:hypothetical protein